MSCTDLLVFGARRGDLAEFWAGCEEGQAADAGGYRSHREKQRRLIVGAARELFDEKGIDRTKMSEIISGSGLRPSTVYQYFPNKDAIVWEIVREIFAASQVRIGAQLGEGERSAYETISLLVEAMCAELVEAPENVRMMAQFDALYARQWSAEQLIALEMELNPEGFELFARLIREGIADGSLRKELDPELTMHAIFNMLIGTQRRLVSLGKRIELEYGRPVDELFRESARILLNGIKA